MNDIMTYFKTYSSKKRKTMMKFSLFILLLFFVQTTFGQTPPTTPPPEYGWKHGLVSSLTLTQVAYTDWAQGGENALAYTISVDGKSIEDESSSNWSTLYKFTFGQTRLGIQGIRKTDDIIDLSTVYTYKLDSYVNPYAAATLKSQFAYGYVYPKQDSSVQVSAFFDPAYLTQRIGAGYQPIKEVKTRLGVGLREVLTNQFNQYADDPTTAGIEKTSVNGGIESVTNVDWQIEDNVLFTMQLEFFAPISHFDETVMRDNSTVTAKVSKYVTGVVSVQLINEKRASPYMQVKQTIALGLSYAIF